jgi:uroporphyrinogen decarboxylase
MAPPDAIHHFVDAEVQVLNPLEAKAGMDVLELRERYGRRLAFYGNIDAPKLSGPQEIIEAELRRTIPIARCGGYILHSDHSCPPDAVLGRDRRILETARALFLEEYHQS